MYLEAEGVPAGAHYIGRAIYEARVHDTDRQQAGTPNLPEGDDHE